MDTGKIDVIPMDKKQARAFATFVAEEQLKKRVVKTRYLGGGSFGKAVSVQTEDGGKTVIKFLCAHGMMEKEVHDLKLLKEHCPVKIPAVFFSRKYDNNIPADCYGMEMIEGKSCLFALGMLMTSKSRRLDFADKITTTLHSIHKCTNSRFGDTMSPDCESWLDYYRPFAESVLEKAETLYGKGRLPQKVIKAMRAAWEKFDVIFSEQVNEACLIHGDLNVGNIMVGKSYAVMGIIDPLNCMYADREYDLFQFDNLTGKRFFLRETYIRKYGASRYCMQKLAFYGLWNEVYCYIKSGMLIGLIINPLVKNMYRRLREL